MDRRRVRIPIIVRITTRLAVTPDGCWVWTGANNGVGYGVVGRGGREGQTYVHRVMYEYHRGPIPDGLILDHLCRNRGCANPSHLEPVTHRENLRRGFGVTGINARKTVCAQGHPFDEANTYVYASGARSCRACARDQQAARRAARGAAA